MKNYCQFCTFYNKLDEGAGECRRKPPVIVAKSKLFSIHAISLFPKVKRNEWCGEHKERESE